jgi:hypothetical protein
VTKHACGGVMAVLLGGTIILSGCSNSSGPQETSGYLSPTSPANVLSNLELSYSERNLDEYLACLSEDFRFNFTEVDQLVWPELPPWYYKSDERQLQENMFGDDWGLDSITLTLEIADAETIPDRDAGAPTGDVVLLRVDTNLRVYMTTGAMYYATDPQDFYFRMVAGQMERRDGAGEWQIFQWEDQDDGELPGCLEDAGWGGIKAHFLESLTQSARRTTPEDVLDQLKSAYIRMNVEDYLDCLSAGFRFFPDENDINDPENPLPAEWFIADETAIHENMFGPSSNVTGVDLSLVTAHMEFDEGVPTDPYDDTWMLTEDVDLEAVVYGGLILLATTPSEFHFRVDPDEEGPYGEPMWEIYEWYDLGPPAYSRSASSWGAIKWMYR